MGLEVNTPLEQAFLIPRWNNGKKVLQCHFELGYKGLIELCYRTNQYMRIEAEVVYEGDQFKYEYGFEAHLRHKPCGKQDKPLFVWALFELINGGKSFKVWTWDQVMRHAEAFSESYDPENPWKSPWLSNPTSQKGMAKKTVLHDALNYAPKSVELAKGLNADGNAVIAKPSEASDSDDDFTYEISPEESESQGQGKKNEEEKEEPQQEGQAQEKAQIAPPDESLRVPRQRSPERKPEPVPAVRTAITPGKRTNGLFPQEEEDALEEQYKQENVEGQDLPDFPS
jgi:recombination protein RecT